MCIIIAKEAGKEPLDMGYFERAWEHNSDGGGIVWKSPEDECAYVQKGFMKKEDMIAKLKEINKKETSFIAHFRIRSVGEVKPENTHPFVMDKVTFAHNGTIHGINVEDGKTDSETFGLMFLKTRSMKWIKENQKLLELALGASKFAIMDNATGEILILNKQNGKEQDGAWFSNGSADKPQPIQYNNYRHYYSNYLPLGKDGFVKARKIFGTKSYTDACIEWSKEDGCWVYTATKKPKSTYPFTDDVVVGRNGLYKFAKDIRPRDFAEDGKYEAHEYKHKDPVYKIIGTAQRLLQHHLGEYWKESFDSIAERDDYEHELSMEHLVLDAARRFVADGLELNCENLWDFVMQNLNISQYCYGMGRTDAEIMVDQANSYICAMFGCDY